MSLLYMQAEENSRQADMRARRLAAVVEAHTADVRNAEARASAAKASTAEANQAFRSTQGVEHADTLRLQAEEKAAAAVVASEAAEARAARLVATLHTRDDELVAAKVSQSLLHASSLAHTSLSSVEHHRTS